MPNFELYQARCADGRLGRIRHSFAFTYLKSTGDDSYALQLKSLIASVNTYDLNHDFARDLDQLDCFDDKNSRNPKESTKEQSFTAIATKHTNNNLD